MARAKETRHGRAALQHVDAEILKEVGVTSQQEIERVVREEDLGGKGALKIKMVITAEGTGLNHVVEGKIDLG